MASTVKNSFASLRKGNRRRRTGAICDRRKAQSSYVQYLQLYIYIFFSRTARLLLACPFATPLRPDFASYAGELAGIFSVECTQVFVINRPFPSSLVPLFQNESKCETFHMKMSSACSFIFMQIKVIFIRMGSLLDSLWKQMHKGTRKWSIVTLCCFDC